MILDKDGRPMYRSIGFIPSLRVEREQGESNVKVACVGWTIPCEDFIPLEEANGNHDLRAA